MKNIIKLLLLISCPLFASCTKHDMPENPTDCQSCVDTLFSSRIVWHTAITLDTMERFKDQIVTDGQIVVYSLLKDGAESNVVARSVSSGKLLWEWGDPSLKSGYFITGLELVGDKIIVESWADLYVIEKNTGKTIWNSFIKPTGECGWPKISAINNQIYFATQECSPASKFVSLMRTSVDAFAPEKLFTINMIETPGPDSGWISRIVPPVLWMHPNGDSILVFQARSFKTGIIKDKVDLYAFDLKTRNLLWEAPSIVDEGNSTLNPIIIKGNEIYFQGLNSIYKLNAMTGQKIWSYKFPLPTEQLTSGNIVVTDDKVVAHPGGSTVYGLDSNTGGLVWTLNKIGCCGVDGDIQLIDQTLYYVAAPYFFAINASQGKVTWQYASPFKFKNGTGNARFTESCKTITTPDRSLLITSDSHYLMAIRTN